MNKVFSYILLAGLAMLSIMSCKKNNLVVDKIVTAPPFAKFNTILAADTIGTYYIKSSNTPYKLPIGITNVSGQDRVIQFTYTSRTAVQGTQYTAPASITIPAGKALDSLTVTGLFAGFPLSTRIDTVKIEITGGDVPASSYKSRYYLILRKYCDVVLANLSGNYLNTNEYGSSGAFSYGPYTTALTNVVSTGATTATASLVNLYDDGWNNISCTLDWTSPSNFKVTIPLQPTGRSYSGAPTSVRTSTSASAIASTFSSCDRSITLAIDLVNNGTTVISSGYRFVMK